MVALSTVAQFKGEDEEVRIPHKSGTVDEGVYISGVLRKQDVSRQTAVPPGPSGRKRAALVLHGVQSHKNQSYHRDLAGALPIDSLRIDFRGNGASSGGPYDPSPPTPWSQSLWNYGSMEGEVRDVRRALQWLSVERGYIVDLVVAHSRGCAVMWEYFTSPEDLAHQTHLPYYVSISGRYNQQRQMQKFGNMKPGETYEWVVPIGKGGLQKHIVTYDSLRHAALQPTPYQASQFPLGQTSVLLIHGDHDETVPPEDATHFLQTLRRRGAQLSGQASNPEKVTLRLIQNADHNFVNMVTDEPITMFDDLINCIKDWYTSRAHVTSTLPSL